MMRVVHFIVFAVAFLLVFASVPILFINLGEIIVVWVLLLIDRLPAVSGLGSSRRLLDRIVKLLFIIADDYRDIARSVSV